MKRRAFMRGAALCAALPLLGRVRAAEPPTITALIGGELIDGAGGEPLADSVILVDGEHIRAIGTVGSLDIPDGAQRVSTEGCTVLPGLWDMNVHLSRLGHADRARWDDLYVPLAQRVVMPMAMHDLLASGVTSVRDVASPLEAVLSMRHRVENLAVPGPLVYASGPALASVADPKAHAYRLSVSGTAEARARTTEILRAGADFIVVRDVFAMDSAELASIVATTHAAQSTVHAEIIHDEDIAPALAAGVDGLIGIGDGAGAWPESAMAALRARLATGRQLIVASTLSPLLNSIWLGRNHEPLDDPRLRDGWPPVVADDVRNSIDMAGALEAAYPNPMIRQASMNARIGALIDAGVIVVAGSGAGDPGHLPARAMWQELEALVRDAGLTPMEAIRRATYWPAVACGQPHLSGTVTVGKYADIISVRGDVLRNIDRLADVEVVLRRGRRVR